MITNAIEFEAKIDADWKISIPLEYYDLIKASESSLDFWNNEDDKVWDNV